MSTPPVTDKVSLAEKLGQFSEHWSPKIVARLNDYDVQVVKLKGEFVWHKHDDTDDFFLVLNTGDAGGPMTARKETI